MGVASFRFKKSFLIMPRVGVKFLLRLALVIKLISCHAALFERKNGQLKLTILIDMMKQFEYTAGKFVCRKGLNCEIFPLQLVPRSGDTRLQPAE